MSKHKLIDDAVLIWMAAKGNAGSSPAHIAAEFPDLSLEDIEASLKRLNRKGFITNDAASYISEQAKEFNAIMAAGMQQTQKADALMTSEICNDDVVFQALHAKYHEKGDALERANKALKHTHGIAEADAQVIAARNLHAASRELASYLEAITASPELGFPGAAEMHLEEMVAQGLIEKRVVNGVTKYRAKRTS